MTSERAGDPPVRTVFIGSGGFGLESLMRLADHPVVALRGVVTAPPRPSGRHQRPTATVIDDAAGSLGIGTILRPERLRAADAISAVLGLEPELVILADYGLIVPPDLLDVPHGALNLHPSLLPRHRGATPIPAAILAGDTVTGVTLMRMDAGLDTGPIVAQATLPLDGTEATPDLEAKLGTVASDLLESNLAAWLRGEIEPTPQPTDGATLTRPLRREDGRLDVSKSAPELERQVRAFRPWPGSFVDTVVGRLIVWRAGVVDEPVDGADRTHGRFGAHGLSTGGSTHLALHEVQPAGGKRMPWEAFVRGHPSILGSAVNPGG